MNIDFSDSALRMLVLSGDAIAQMWGPLASDVRVLIWACWNSMTLAELLAFGFVALMTPVALRESGQIMVALRSVTLSAIALRADGTPHTNPNRDPHEVHGLNVFDLAVGGISFAHTKAVG